MWRRKRTLGQEPAEVEADGDKTKHDYLKHQKPVDGVVAFAVAWGAPVDILYPKTDVDADAHDDPPRRPSPQPRNSA